MSRAWVLAGDGNGNGLQVERGGSEASSLSKTRPRQLAPSSTFDGVKQLFLGLPLPPPTLFLMCYGGKEVLVIGTAAYALFSRQETDEKPESQDHWYGS
jgi:hypothetical protein